jgi:integrase
MHAAGDDAEGVRLRGLIVVLWRAGLRVSEALALVESDLDPGRGAILVRHGKGGKRRQVGMDRWAWDQLAGWRTATAGGDRPAPCRPQPTCWRSTRVARPMPPKRKPNLQRREHECNRTGDRARRSQRTVRPTLLRRTPVFGRRRCRPDVDACGPVTPEGGHGSGATASRAERAVGSRPPRERKEESRDWSRGIAAIVPAEEHAPRLGSHPHARVIAPVSPPPGAVGAQPRSPASTYSRSSAPVYS